jgi:hypothetical protein
MSRLTRPTALLSLVAFVAITSAASAGFETQIVSFCNSKLGKQVGSGECAHLATEALRISGAEFMRNGMADSPIAGDYVWGTIVKGMSKNASGTITDTKPSNKVMIGDIIQYRLTAGKTHHTAIVAAVNTSGFPTAVFEQNFNAQRFVVKNTTDLHKLLREKGGYLNIYRAKAPVSTTRTEFTLVNNAQSTPVSFKIFGNNQSIGGKNTASGYAQWWGTGTITIVVGNQTYTVAKRKGYEFYLSGGVIKLRALAQ